MVSKKSELEELVYKTPTMVIAINKKKLSLGILSFWEKKLAKKKNGGFFFVYKKKKKFVGDPNQKKKGWVFS